MLRINLLYIPIGELLSFGMNLARAMAFQEARHARANEKLTIFGDGGFRTINP